jgi:hypothetical protein
MRCDLQNLESNLIDDEVIRTKERFNKLTPCFESVESEGSFEICPTVEFKERMDDLITWIRTKIAIYNEDIQTKERFKASLKEAAEEILKRAE